MRKYYLFVLLLFCIFFSCMTTGCCSAAIKDSETESRTFSDVSESEAAISTSILDYTETEKDFQIFLNNNLLNNLQEASYSIIGWNEGNYYLILSNRTVSPDPNHIIHIPKDQSIVTLYVEEIDAYLPINRIKETLSQNNTRQWHTGFLSRTDENSLIYDICPMNLDISSSNNSSDHTLTYTMSPRLSGTDNPLTADVAYEYWDSVRFSRAYTDNIYDNFGTILPTDEWTYDRFDSFCYSDTNIDSGLNFQTQSLQNLSGTYYCQLILKLKDTSTVASDLMLLQEDPCDPYNIDPTPDISKTSIISTENGQLTFEIIEGHAVLTKYTGEDTTLTIPDLVNGVPVTIIADHVFADNTLLKKIDLPDTLLQIKPRAFYGTNLTNIRLPDNLEYIGNEAFGNSALALLYSEDCSFTIKEIYLGSKIKWIGTGAFDGYRIEKYNVSPDNPYYMSCNGMIYTKDQSFLLSCPTGKNGTVILPDGVIGIDTEAFKNNGCFSTVIADSKGITSLSLADSVQSFSCLCLPKNLESLSIGSRLENWDYIFNCSELSELTISLDNPFYQMDNGVIYNGDKTELIYCFDMDAVTEFTIPETITRIEEKAFQDMLYLRELKFTRNLNLSGMDLSELSQILYLPDNLLNINVEKGNTSFCSVDGVLFTSDMSVLISYPRGKENTDYTVPESVSAISAYAFYYNDIIISIHLPAALRALKLTGEYGNCLEYIANLTDIYINEENTYFFAEGPFLISRLENALIFSSGNYKTPIVYFPEGLAIIPDDVFDLRWGNSISEIHISDGVTTIGANNFNNIPQKDQWDFIDIYFPDTLTDISENSFLDSPGIVFHGSADSYAAVYAKDKHITFEIVE